MSTLLIKRLARSLWRTKLRLFAVLAMVTVGVMTGVSFGSYAETVAGLYDHIYDDTDDGVNLPDLWVENPLTTWDGPTADAMCAQIQDEWPDTRIPLKTCEARLRLPGQLSHVDESGEAQLVRSVWHGIDEGETHRVWMPEHETVEGRLAESESEVVLDAHSAHGMEISVGDTVTLSAGSGDHEFTVSGIGYHADHLFFAELGDIAPAKAGSFMTGYMTDEGLERLAGLTPGTSNLLLLDIEGTPEYDLQSTPENEGEALAAVVTELSSSLAGSDEAPVMVYDRSAVYSVELLRADVEGAAKTYPFITGMLALVAGITIFLSLQRLIQSQAREIAILRTLGVGRKTLMPAYVIAPVVIGLIGAAVGAALGIWFGAPGMRDMYESIMGLPVVIDGMSTSMIAQNIGIALFIVFLSGIQPAWKASRLQPLDVLRGQHEVRLGSRRIQRWTSGLPTTIGLTIRSSIRKPVRLLFTFLGVGLSMLLFGSMLVMMAAMDDLASGGFAEKETWDATVQVDPTGEEAVVAWAKAEGVTHERMLTVLANPKDDPRQFSLVGHDKIGLAAGESLSLLKLDSGSAPLVAQSPPQVLIDEGTSIFLEWQTGETQAVTIGATEIEVEIVGITKGEMTRTVHFHREDLSERVGISANSIMLALPDDMDSSELEESLAPLSQGINHRQATLDAFAEVLEKQQQFFQAIIMMGILIAGVVLFNTLLMNLAERDQELATLRVLGAPITRLGWMMFLEHLAIGIVGGLIGCVFSVLGAQAMIEASVQWAFYFTVVADPSSLGIILGTVVFISVSLTPFGMWRIRKMDLVEKVKAQ